MNSSLDFRRYCCKLICMGTRSDGLHSDVHACVRVSTLHRALHPGPYTLHPGPWTLDPTPWTLHPGPYTLDPTPNALHLTLLDRKPLRVDPTLQAHVLYQPSPVSAKPCAPNSQPRNSQSLTLNPKLETWTLNLVTQSLALRPKLQSLEPYPAVPRPWILSPKSYT
jgi:hypothetical protein